MKCDISNKEATDFDSWFNLASCEEHKNISPVARQQHPNYKWERKGDK